LPVRPPARDGFYLYLEVGVVNETTTAVFSERVSDLLYSSTSEVHLNDLPLSPRIQSHWLVV
ncbi:hypothetical protein Ancab_001174, partial [Ancistrocladus abbreviatus]